MTLQKWFKEILRAKEGSLLNQYISKAYPEQHIAMLYNRQKPCPGGKMTKSKQTKGVFLFFNGFAKISTSITKSWSEVTPLVLRVVSCCSVLW